MDELSRSQNGEVSLPTDFVSDALLVFWIKVFLGYPWDKFLERSKIGLMANQKVHSWYIRTAIRYENGTT
jgi:hypothetical protein